MLYSWVNRLRRLIQDQSHVLFGSSTLANIPVYKRGGPYLITSTLSTERTIYAYMMLLVMLDRHDVSNMGYGHVGCRPH